MFGLSGLQGGLDDWPTALVPLKEAYLWLLKEAEDLRKGTAELIHYQFLDYCFGVEAELMEWAPDMHQNNTLAWNLCRYNEVRKRSSGMIVTLMGPLYVANKWLKKETFISCYSSHLLYDESIVTALANDLIGVKKDHQQEVSETISMTSLKFASVKEIAQAHNERVTCLRKNILDLHGDERIFMEEIEVAVAGLFLWQCNARHYN